MRGGGRPASLPLNICCSLGAHPAHCGSAGAQGSVGAGKGRKMPPLTPTAP